MDDDDCIVGGLKTLLKIAKPNSIIVHSCHETQAVLAIKAVRYLSKLSSSSFVLGLRRARDVVLLESPFLMKLDDKLSEKELLDSIEMVLSNDSIHFEITLVVNRKILGIFNKKKYHRIQYNL